MYTFFQKFSKLEGKSKKVERKKQKLVLMAVLLITSCILGGYVTYFMGRRLVKSIYYIPKENKFELNFFNFFCFNKRVIYKPEEIGFLQKKLRFDSTV
jgi:hypothetical protein